MLAMCVAGQQGLHFSLRWATNLLPLTLREVLRVFVLGFNCIVLVFLAYAGVRYLSVINTLTATATHINLVWIYSAIPVGCAGLFLINFSELADAVLAPLTGQHLGAYRRSEEAAYNQLLMGGEE
jgi:TRAP-type C4-dicarboxylate transport system permease small subunit